MALAEDIVARPVPAILTATRLLPGVRSGGVHLITDVDAFVTAQAYPPTVTTSLAEVAENPTPKSVTSGLSTGEYAMSVTTGVTTGE